MPKVSVLMGVYNNADTVNDSIDSILKQTFTDWEFIICDDGSNDNTEQIIEEYIKNDSRIKLIKNDKNQGLPFTLNKCIAAASGEYCARMDGDDTCDPCRLQKQVDFLDSHNEYGFVSTRMTRYDEIGIYQIPEKIASYEPTKMDLIKGSPYCHAPVMIRKAVYEMVGGYRDIPQTQGVEDYDLWFRLFSLGVKGYILQEPLYHMFDGRAAAKRRTFKRRINEAWVRKEGYKLIRAPFYLRIYVLKPLIIGLLPQWLYILIHK